MGRRQGGPSRTCPEGAYLNRYVTDEQRSRRPIFIPTLRAGASWLFFRVARSTRMTQIWVLRSRLEKQPTDLRQYACYFGDRTPSASEERTRCDASRTSNDADEPFQADPEGRWRFSDFLRCSLLT